MRWEYPELRLCLWILPMLAWLMVYAHLRRRLAAKKFLDEPMLGRLAPIPGWRRLLAKTVLLLLGLGLLIVGAARPRYGAYYEDVQARGIDLFVLLDVSRSMLAEDVAPNRLERAKSDVRDLLSQLRGDRVGLIAFAGTPVMHVPLTVDHDYFGAVLSDLSVEDAPRGGTLIGDAIRKALTALDKQGGRDQVIVLITDGEDQESFPQNAAIQAEQLGVKIIAIGLGDSAEGARIPVRDPEGGVSYVRDRNGNDHWSSMNGRLLKEIAFTTGGAYIPAKTQAYDIGKVYRDHLADLTGGEFRTKKRRRYRERFQVFVCLGLGLVLLEMVIPAYRRDLAGPDRSAAGAER